MILPHTVQLVYGMLTGVNRRTSFTLMGNAFKVIDRRASLALLRNASEILGMDLCVDS